MDFFNDIGKRFTNAAKTVQKRTREGAEISKLHSALRALKDERKKLFTSLGETYFKSLEDGDGADQLEFLVEQLKQLAVKEKELQAQVDKLSQQKRCVKCGSVVGIEAKFCPNCGERIPEEAPAEAAPEASQPVEYCPSCGAVRQAYSRFCIVCGKPFEQEAPQPAEAEAGEETEAEPEQRIEMEIKWPRATEAAEPAGDGEADKAEE